mmetsp:Transcript_4078/g.5968  ORF Transcript_4078/g.5968 Transcript_4078/m.5968 type:complete len:98 (+) Transcript_4078:1-294(+)
MVRLPSLSQLRNREKVGEKVLPGQNMKHRGHHPAMPLSSRIETSFSPADGRLSQAANWDIFALPVATGMGFVESWISHSASVFAASNHAWKTGNAQM